MGLFKADFYRFFALGFVGGALVVLGVVGFDGRHSLADNIVPPAHAQATR